jgi:hypothetical protein
MNAYLILTNPSVITGDVSERLAMRDRLQCNSFDWYYTSPGITQHIDSIT